MTFIAFFYIENNSNEQFQYFYNYRRYKRLCRATYPFRNSTKTERLKLKRHFLAWFTLVSDNRSSHKPTKNTSFTMIFWEIFYEMTNENNQNDILLRFNEFFFHFLCDPLKLRHRLNSTQSWKSTVLVVTQRITFTKCHTALEVYLA